MTHIIKALATLAALAMPHVAAAQDGLRLSIDAVGADAQTAADHIAIVELSNQFENAFDEGDLDAHMATWADEISFTSPFGNYDDRDGYRDWVSGFMGQMAGMGGTRHLITNAVIAVDGDTARQTCYLVIVGRTMNEGGPAMMATVRFEDELVRTEGGWRFSSRELILDQDPAMFGGQ
ncbi:nuclear transport factor 2 family protein [Jannaschia sp. S6380]|uniref:nuclear transport factor 2 family protein n=1 Tax=Jannaschia sp. S6380 TaxID=2926408 RepID=UPI001FF554E5|nr:nuclear transport factor 2 family protein [Jannaschia sp. S6380]MCK0167259.1 nuclear transport factor 2 family protein [Jannaschia sp. S6380]